MPSLQEGDSQLRLVPQLWPHALQSCPAKRIAQRSFGRGGVCAWLRQRLVLAGLLMSPCRNTPWSSFWWVVQHCTHKLKKRFIVNIAESGLRLDRAPLPPHRRLWFCSLPETFGRIEVMAACRN
jgi:hypothetical protein